MKNLVKLLMPISGSVLIWSLSSMVMPNAKAQSIPTPIITKPPFKIFQAPSEIPCPTFLQPYIDWLKASPKNHIVASVANNTGTNGVVTYSLGELKLDGNSLTGTLRDLKSDRTFCPQTGGSPGSFGSCLPDIQPFSVYQPASSNLTLPLPLTSRFSQSKMVCYDNSTAIILAPAYTSVVTLLKGTDPIVR